jgi:hypothetical protein
MSGLHQFRSMTGTGGAELAPYYVALPNSGALRRTSLSPTFHDWVQPQKKESYELYAQCIRSPVGSNSAGLFDFCSALFGSVNDSSFLKGFEQFMAPEWDGDEAKAVSKKDLKFARTLLERIAPYLPGAPDAAPGTDGSICMEWIASGPSGQKKVFVDVTPGDEVLTFARLGEARPVEKHFKKSDQMLIMYLQNVFNFFATK